MNKGKFASLIMLGAFSAGIASSSAVSAQGDENLASILENKVDSIYIGSQNDSATTDFNDETHTENKASDNNSSDTLNNVPLDNVNISGNRTESFLQRSAKFLAGVGVGAAALKCTEFSIDKLKGKKDDGNSVDGYVDDNLLNKKIEKLEEELNLAKQKNIKAIDDKLEAEKRFKEIENIILPNNRAWLWGFMSYAYEKLGYFGEGKRDPGAGMTMHKKGWRIFFSIFNFILTVLVIIVAFCNRSSMTKSKDTSPVFYNIAFLFRIVSAILCPLPAPLFSDILTRVVEKEKIGGKYIIFRFC